jgi:acyl-CoA reductase-like NAD-dependent aldehyde dehydrogenase
MAATMTEHKLLIDGEWVETGDWIEVRSPYSGDVVGRVAKGGAAEARRAVDAAARVLAEPLPAHKRAEILVKVAGGIGRRHEELAQTISAEAGKPIKAARIEASRAMSTYTFAAAEARKLTGEMIAMDGAQAGEGKLGFTLRKPIGVIGAISPFNFPCNLVAHKIAPALAAGCPVVLKPASQTPMSALFLAELELEAGLPPGWLNVVVGPASEIGDVLVEDERVKLITFTGSSGVGWGLQVRAPRKRVKLELGNSTPVIVAADADVDTAATKLAANAFAFAGQTCISVQRIYVDRAVHDAFVAAFLPKVEALVVGDPADDDTDVGPVIDPGARSRILEWIDEGRRRADPPDRARRRPGRRERELRGGLRPRRDRQPDRLPRGGHRPCERDEVRPPGGDLHRLDRLGAPRSGRARVRWGHGQRGAVVPQRPDALRRGQGVREHEGRACLGRARDDRGAARRHPALASGRRFHGLRQRGS